MSSFTSPLIVTPLPDGRSWKLVQEFDYYIGKESNQNIIHVPEGFVTDFASVPRPLWFLMPPWGVYGKAAVIHDYGYSTKIRTRKETDQIFLEGMLVLGTPKWMAKLMYFAVDKFGWLAWYDLPLLGWIYGKFGWLR
uniref:DUF1353 domain-containing protein n=1 Tax=viral metagenome TaxID=1070528 RepID=A0A6M3J8R7_9ZZZZ